jgi:ABC-type multidrug transport system fused ATPase/permease subunit
MEASDELSGAYKLCTSSAKIVGFKSDLLVVPSLRSSFNTLIVEAFIYYVLATLHWHYSCYSITTRLIQESGEIDHTMGNVALKHICLWMFLLLLFFLLLYGVHLFFFSRAESRLEQKISETKSTMGNPILSTNASIIMEKPPFVRN